jgi:deazaflavin-dependent oxidoreductase (nitroreductase family)
VPGKRNRRLLRAITCLHVAIYRASGGRVGHHLPGAAPILLLDHIGARSGRRHTTPVAYMREDQNVIVVGANLGEATDPGWVHNLRAHPHTAIQIASVRRRVHAREADAEERQRLWAQAVRYNPAWGRYQAHARRPFPVMILTLIGVATTRCTCETDA